jgi:uncharacterized membrane protein
MRLTYASHILAGSLALVFGYVALYAVKGAVLHRKSGMLFVYAMLTMCVFGTLIAMVRGVAPAINIPAGVLSAYLVTMFYWLWRVRIRRSLRGFVGSTTGSALPRLDQT